MVRIKTDSSQSQSGDYDPDEDETEAEVTVVHQTPARMDMDESLMDIDEHDSQEVDYDVILSKNKPF